MNWLMGVFILQFVTLLMVALIGASIVQGLNRIEGTLETISDLIAYDRAPQAEIGGLAPDGLPFHVKEK